MRKEELRKLKRINATPKMVRMAKDNKRDVVYHAKYNFYTELKKSTVYDMMVRCQQRGCYLMVCIFFPEKIARGELTPTYEVYCNPEGNEYITRILSNGREQKWSSAMTDNLGTIYYKLYDMRFYKGTEKRIWQNPEGKKTIQKILGTKNDGLRGLVEWQQKTREKIIYEKEKRQKEPWDADMALVPDIMPSFDAWMKKEAVNEYFIFYEYSKKTATEGYCSHCRRMVAVTKPRHNEYGICAHCGVRARYKSRGRIKTLQTKEYYGQAIQRIRGGIVARKFQQRQWYMERDHENPKSYLYETERILLMDDGTAKRYYYGNYKNKEWRFVLDNDYSPGRRNYYDSCGIKLYTKNLYALKRTVLKNSTADMWEYMPMGVFDYIVMERRYPVIEKVVKINMFNMARVLLRKIAWKETNAMLDGTQTELAKILKLDRSRLNRMKAMDGGLEHLRWMQYEKTVNTVFPDEMIKNFAENNILPEAFGFLPLPLKYVKIWHYMKKQAGLSNMRLSDVCGTWRDYINMAEQEKMDVTNEMIWKPKRLYDAHQELVMIRMHGEIEKEAEKLARKWPKVNEQLPKLQKYEYSDGEYAVIAPKTIEDIVREGRVLQHCVHTCDFYFDRIGRDESYLFFLRREGSMDIPWYTLEVEPNGNIRQKRTTGDNQNKDFEQAVEFLKKWQKEFVKRMSEKDKELGVRADQARIREYAELRENGNKIWHGRLAGQLLADVLENDFMAAVM